MRGGAQRLLLSVVVLACVVVSASQVWAGSTPSVVIVTDSKVPQYREAQSAAQQVLPDGQLLDVNDPELRPQLDRATAASAVLLAIGSKALLAAQSTGASVVFCMVLGPSVGSAVGAAKNITGLRLEVAPSVQFGFIRRVHPKAKRLGVLFEPRAWAPYVKEATQAAQEQGLTLVTRPVADARDVRGALAEIAGDIDALWLLPDPTLVSVEIFNFLLVSTLERKIALFGFFADFTRRGALASVAPDYTEIGRQAAKLAAELAAKPAAARSPLPPSQASPGSLSLNAKTARQLGLDLSDDAQSAAKQVVR